MQDVPPAGVTVTSFQVQVTGVSLTGTAPTANATLLTAPITVNLSNLDAVDTLLENTTATAGTYSGITIAFANPQLTLFNDSGVTLTDGTTACPSIATTLAPCTLAPLLSSVTATITAAPFPLTVVSGTPIHLALDFNTATSLIDTTNTLTITPAVTASVVTTTNATTMNIADFVNVTGQVVSSAANKVVATDLSTGQSLSLTGATATTYTGFVMSGTCTTANTFACIQAGQIINFNYGISGAVASTPVLESVNLNAGVTAGLTGTVVEVNQVTHGFEVMVNTETPAFATQAPTLKVGQVATVAPTVTPTFAIQSNGATLPNGLVFGAVTNMIVGQTVLLDSTGFVAGSVGVPGVITADAVTLIPSQFGGTVGAVNVGAQTFTIVTLNGLFTQNAITTITADSVTATTYTGVTGGFTGLAATNVVTVGGLLFSGPVLVAAQVAVP